MVLPIHATPESQDRLDIALEVVAAMGLKEADIALTGSVARGVADHYSDIELMIWRDELPTAETCETLLEDAGLEVDAATDEWMGSITTKSWFEGILIETAWHTRANLNQQIKSVISAETIDHWALVWVWHIIHALPLNEAAMIRGLQRRLRAYPEALRTALIANGNSAWSEPTWYPLSIVNTAVLGERAAARLGGGMALSGKLHTELERMLRVLFAVNRQWEPDFKWIAYESERLPLKPPRLLERMDQVFAKASPIERTHICLQLILDTLQLVPDTYNVSHARAQVEAALYPDRLIGNPGDETY
jgi:predicted nucleotidyltransferase